MAIGVLAVVGGLTLLETERDENQQVVSFCRELTQLAEAKDVSGAELVAQAPKRDDELEGEYREECGDAFSRLEMYEASIAVDPPQYESQTPLEPQYDPDDYAEPETTAEPAEPAEEPGDAEGVPAELAEYGVDTSEWRIFSAQMLSIGYITDTEAAYEENWVSLGFTALTKCTDLQTASVSELAQAETLEFGTPLYKTEGFFSAAQELCDGTSGW